MTEYRIYGLDRGGHVNSPPQVIKHETDEEAIRHAVETFDGREIELWKGAQRLLHLPHDDTVH